MKDDKWPNPCCQKSSRFSSFNVENWEIRHRNPVCGLGLELHVSCRSAWRLKRGSASSLWSLRLPLPHPTSFSLLIPPVNEFMKPGLNFSRKYLKMLSHVGWIYTEEIIQTADASEGSVVHWGFGKEYLVGFNTVLPINITVATNQK